MVRQGSTAVAVATTSVIYHDVTTHSAIAVGWLPWLQINSKVVALSLLSCEGRQLDVQQLDEHESIRIDIEHQLDQVTQRYASTSNTSSTR